MVEKKASRKRQIGFSWKSKILNWRVWSWLRLNVGGTP